MPPKKHRRWDADVYAQLMVKKRALDAAIKKAEKEHDTEHLASLYRQRSNLTAEISQLISLRGR